MAVNGPNTVWTLKYRDKYHNMYSYLVGRAFIYMTGCGSNIQKNKIDSWSVFGKKRTEQKLFLPHHSLLSAFFDCKCDKLVRRLHRAGTFMSQW